MLCYTTPLQEWTSTVDIIIGSILGALIIPVVVGLSVCFPSKPPPKSDGFIDGGYSGSDG
jgi:hypothetical protein